MKVSANNKEPISFQPKVQRLQSPILDKDNFLCVTPKINGEFDFSKEISNLDKLDLDSKVSNELIECFLVNMIQSQQGDEFRLNSFYVMTSGFLKSTGKMKKEDFKSQMSVIFV